MIVDDHPLVVEALTRLLQTDARLEVTACARTLAGARSLLSHLKPDVIVLDLRLPDSQAYATITTIRSCCGAARIVVLTGSADVDAEHSRRCGADAYLDKQTESAHIVDTILNVADLLPATRPPSEPLSRRELEVARLAAQGLTNGEIASMLHVTEHTIHTHIAHILAKLGFRNRTELARHWRVQKSSPTGGPDLHPDHQNG